MSNVRSEWRKRSDVSSGVYAGALLLFVLCCALIPVALFFALIRALDGRYVVAMSYMLTSVLFVLSCEKLRRVGYERVAMSIDQIVEEDVSIIMGMRYRLLWGGALASLPALILGYGVITDPSTADAVVMWILAGLVFVSVSSIVCAVRIHEFRRSTVYFGYLFSFLYIFNLPFGPILGISTFLQTRKVAHYFRS